jgi:hypothetical protein
VARHDPEMMSSPISARDLVNVHRDRAAHRATKHDTIQRINVDGGYIWPGDDLGVSPTEAESSRSEGSDVAGDDTERLRPLSPRSTLGAERKGAGRWRNRIRRWLSHLHS